MVYEEAEDTFLMEKALEKEDVNGKKILEIGIGNGYNAIKLAKRRGLVYGVDIDPNAINFVNKSAKNDGVSVSLKESDIFNNISEKDFDLIYFNPPYLVSDKIKHIDLDGGKEGREVIDKFLKDFDRYLSKNGKVLLLHTNHNNLEKTRNILSKKGFKYEIVERQKLFFEELYILLIF